jgi:hypothetical protein
VSGVLLEDLPPDVVSAVAAAVGGRPLTFAPVRTFFASDLAGIVTGAAGRLFVKAVRSGRPMAADYRTEARVGAAMPPTVPTPRLHLVIDAPGWLLLGFEALDGRVPHEPWRPGQLAAVLDAVTVTGRALDPAPLDGLPSVADRLRGRSELWASLAANGRARHLSLGDLGGWERANLGTLAEVEDRWPSLVAGEALLHFDLRHSNVVIDAAGRAWIVDWGRASLGPAWVDVVCLLLESRFEAGDADAAVRGHPLAAAAHAEALDALLVALLGYWTLEAQLPAHPFITGLRERQEASRRATRSWLRSRWAARR